VLEAFGVDETAEAVYLAMLQHPDAPPAQLAALLGLDEHRLRTAYDDLAELSLLRPSWQDPTTVRPVSPEVALEPLIAHQRAELADRQLRPPSPSWSPNAQANAPTPRPTSRKSWASTRSANASNN